MLYTLVDDQKRARIARGERATCRDLLATIMSVEGGEWAVAGDLH